jgi:GTP-binding protein Era
VSAHRCGFAALLGRPNAGKSTLLNALLGEKLAIVSPKAQTTRGRLLGAVHRPDAQILLVDTPGVHRGQARFNQDMSEAALESAARADVRVLLLDARASWGEVEAQLAELPAPRLLVRTQCDLVRRPLPVPEAVVAGFAAELEISALTGAGLPQLLDAIAALLPESPALYPEDFLTDTPLRVLGAELIREVAFEQLRDEVPYAVAVEVQEWKEREGAVHVRADVLVQRETQKAIVIGQGGTMLKAIGSEARRRLALLVGQPAHLQLWVKADPRWMRRRRARELGYL